jgi:hypothetical protein
MRPKLLETAILFLMLATLLAVILICTGCEFPVEVTMPDCLPDTMP